MCFPTGCPTRQVDLVRETDRDIEAARASICDWAYVAFAVVAVPALAASLARIPAIGWQWNMGLHIVAAVLMWSMVLLRKKVSHKMRARLLVGLFLAVGLAGPLRLGAIAASLPLATVAPILASILLGTRSAIWVTAAALVGLTAIAIATIALPLTPNIDVAAYSMLPMAWATMLVALAISAITSVAATIASNSRLTNSLQDARAHREELIELKGELEAQVAERTRELEAAKQAAEHLARTDELTDLANRRSFFELAELIHEQAKRHRQPYSVVMLDVDHFKPINDTHGHNVGDAVLRVIGDTLGRTIRACDVVGRLGGEEFGVLLPQTQLDGAEQLAERLRLAAAEIAVPLETEEIRLTVSVGVAQWPGDGVTFDDVLSRADAALYRAKQAGRNRVETSEA